MTATFAAVPLGNSWHVIHADEHRGMSLLCTLYEPVAVRAAELFDLFGLVPTPLTEEDLAEPRADRPSD